MLDLSKNHFELFGLPVGFVLDAKRLAERYCALQASIRPFRLAAEAEPEPTEAPGAAVRVDAAYRTLRDPLERAEYLLALHTGHPDTDRDPGGDPAFFVDRMELQEVLARPQGRADPRTAVLLTQLAERSLSLDRELRALFSDPSAENLEAARDVVRRLRFLDRFRQEAEGLGAESER